MKLSTTVAVASIAATIIISRVRLCSRKVWSTKWARTLRIEPASAESGSTASVTCWNGAAISR